MTLVKELLKRNANVNSENSVGVTPIWNALNYPEIVSLLIENGAKTDIVLEGIISVLFMNIYSQRYKLKFYKNFVIIKIRKRSQSFRNWFIK